MIEGDVNALAAHCQRRFIQFHVAADRHGKSPGGAGVDRLGEHDRAFAVLQPRRIHGAPIGGVHGNLGVKLARSRFEHHMRRLPGLAVVAARDQQHGGHAAVLATGNPPVVWIENVDPARTIRRHRRFPLISGGQTDPLLPGKLR